MEEVKETTESGLIIAMNKDKEQSAQVRGKVVALAEGAFNQLIEKPVVGDIVLYQRHAGMKVLNAKSEWDNNLLLLNDEDVAAIVRA